MSGLDYALLALIAVCVVLALRAWHKGRKNGSGCCGDCSKCCGRSAKCGCDNNRNNE